jgi:hypothetical protein
VKKQNEQGEEKPSRDVKTFVTDGLEHLPDYEQRPSGKASEAEESSIGKREIGKNRAGAGAPIIDEQVAGRATIGEV